MAPSYWWSNRSGGINFRGKRQQIATQAISVAEFEKSPANLRKNNRIRGFQCAIEARPIRGKNAASRRNLNRAPSDAKFVPRTSGQVPRRPLPWAHRIEDRPRRESRSCLARPDGPP